MMGFAKRNGTVLKMAMFGIYVSGVSSGIIWPLSHIFSKSN